MKIQLQWILRMIGTKVFKIYIFLHLFTKLCGKDYSSSIKINYSFAVASTIAYSYAVYIAYYNSVNTTDGQKLWIRIRVLLHLNLAWFIFVGNKLCLNQVLRSWISKIITNTMAFENWNPNKYIFKDKTP